MIGNLGHVAIAVPDLDAAISQYKNVFGAFVTSPQDLPHHGVRVAMVKLLNTTIELITPMGQTSPLKKFFVKHPAGGIHHLCYEVTNITKARDSLLSAGLHVIGDGNPMKGYHGNPVLFFNPKDCMGALIELEEITPSDTHASIQKTTPGAIPFSPALAPDSMEGVPGIGLEIEVDFKSTTPEDNGEGE